MDNPKSNMEEVDAVRKHKARWTCSVPHMYQTGTAKMRYSQPAEARKKNGIIYDPRRSTNPRASTIFVGKTKMKFKRGKPQKRVIVVKKGIMYFWNAEANTLRRVIPIQDVSFQMKTKKKFSRLAVTIPGSKKLVFHDPNEVNLEEIKKHLHSAVETSTVASDLFYDVDSDIKERKQKRSTKTEQDFVKRIVASPDGHVNLEPDTSLILKSGPYKGHTVLTFLATLKKTQAIRTLLCKDASGVNATDSCGNTPLHVAMKNSDADTVELLLEFGARLNVLNYTGRSPADVASPSGIAYKAAETFCAQFENLIRTGDLYGLQRRLQNYKGSSFRNLNGESLLHLACKHGRPNMIRPLLDDFSYSVQDRDLRDRLPVHTACAECSEDTSRALLTTLSELDSPLFEPDIAGCTPLHLAAYSANNEACKFLCEEIGSTEQYQYLDQPEGIHLATPLHIAIARKNYEGIRVLLTYGASLTAEDMKGKPPRALAKSSDKKINNILQSEELVRNYVSNLKAGTWTRSQGRAGIAEQIACSRISEDVLRPSRYNHPFREAIIAGNLEAVKELTQTGISANTQLEVRDNGKRVEVTAREFASRCGQQEIANYLKSKDELDRLFYYISTKTSQAVSFIRDFLQRTREDGLSLDTVNAEGLTMLSAAAKVANVEVVELLKKEVDVNSQDYSKEGRAPLHWAVASKSVPTVKALLSIEGIHIDVRDKSVEQKTPLLLAAEGGNMEILNLLLDAGADVSLQTAQSKDILEIARDCGHDKLLGVLKDYFNCIQLCNFLRSHRLDEAQKIVHNNCFAVLARTGNSETALHIAASLDPSFAGHAVEMLLLETQFDESSIQRLRDAGEPHPKLKCQCWYLHKNQQGQLASEVASANGNYQVASRIAGFEALAKLARIIDDHNDDEAGQMRLRTSIQDFGGNIDLNERLPSGEALIHLIAVAGKVGLFDVLHDKYHIDLNVMNVREESAIYLAGKYLNKSMFSRLLLLGAKTDRLKALFNQDINTIVSAINEMQPNRKIKQKVAREVREEMKTLLSKREEMQNVFSIAVQNDMHSLEVELKDKGLHDAESIGSLRNSKGLSLLHAAAQANAVESIRCLFQLGIPFDLRDEHDRLALAYAPEGSEALAYLKSAETMFDLVNAVRRHETQKALTLIDTIDRSIINDFGQGASSFKGDHGLSAVHFAMIYGETEILRNLLLAGFSSMVKSDGGLSILHWGAISGNNDAVAAMLAFRGEEVEIDGVDVLNNSPLMYACQYNRSDVVKTLLNHSANPDRRDKRFRTPLMHCIISHQNDSIHALLEGNRVAADLNLQDKDGRTALTNAILYGNLRAVNSILDLGKGSLKLNSHDKYNLRALDYACARGSLIVVKKIVEFDSIVTTGPSNVPILSFAAASGNVDLVEWLLETCPAEESAGCLVPPILVAIVQGFVDIARLLIQRGANPSPYLSRVAPGSEMFEVVQKHRQGLLLMSFVESGNVFEVRKLLTGPDASVLARHKNDTGETVLHIAASTGNAEMVDVILNCAPELVGARTRDGKSVEQYVGNDDNLGSQFLRSIQKYKTAQEFLNRCENESSPNIIREAFNVDASDLNVNATDEAGNTCLHKLAMNPALADVYPTAFQLCFVKLEAYNREGLLPLHVAIAMNNAAFVRACATHDPSIFTKMVRSTDLEGLLRIPIDIGKPKTSLPFDVLCPQSPLAFAIFQRAADVIDELVKVYKLDGTASSKIREYLEQASRKNSNVEADSDEDASPVVSLEQIHVLSIRINRLHSERRKKEAELALLEQSKMENVGEIETLKQSICALVQELAIEELEKEEQLMKKPRVIGIGSGIETPPTHSDTKAATLPQIVLNALNAEYEAPAHSTRILRTSFATASYDKIVSAVRDVLTVVRSQEEVVEVVHESPAGRWI